MDQKGQVSVLESLEIVSISTSTILWRREILNGGRLLIFRLGEQRAVFLLKNDSVAGAGSSIEY